MVDAVCQLDLNRFLFLQKCGLQKVPRSLSFYQIPVIISKTHPSFLGQLAYNKPFIFFSGNTLASFSKTIAEVLGPKNKS